jgi:bacterioferritin-associated ferredoxin
MIVCSCNVLSDTTIRSCLRGEDCPRTPSAVYKCLGCSPNCGRCAKTVRSMISEALGACATGCDAACPHGGLSALAASLAGAATA